MGSTTNATRPKIIAGAGPFGTPRFPDIPSIKAFCDLFRSYGHTHFDSARGYPNENPGFADKALNLAGATEWATIDTKVDSLGAKAHGRERANESMRLSLEALGFEEGKKQVDVMFLHAPCPDVPFEEVMEVMNDAYERGLFRRFGLSNYSPQQVEDLVAIAKAKGYVQPTVYEGQYNPIARSGEKDLFPVLRKHGIAFHAYTPAGAGIFSGKVSADSKNNATGRWTNTNPLGKFFAMTYLKPELLDAANRVHTEAQKHGITGHEVALRWVLHHSALKAELGDGMIIGSSSLEQLDANLKMCDAGPLPDDLVKVVEEVWEIAAPVAPWAYMETPPPELLKILEDMTKQT